MTATEPLHRFGGRKRFDTRPGVIPAEVRQMRALHRAEDRIDRVTTVAGLDPWGLARFDFPTFDARYRRRPYDHQFDDAKETT